MPPKHPLMSPLHSLLDRLHPLFTCCASCGEIARRGRGYVCGSLSPDFSVDCVILPASGASPSRRHLAGETRKHLPWLRHIHRIEASPPSHSGRIAENGESNAQNDSQSGTAVKTDEQQLGRPRPERFLSGLTDLSEHFLVLPETLPANALVSSDGAFRRLAIQDFFTPNGIPLLRVRETALLSSRETAFSCFMSERGLKDEPRLCFATLLPALTR